MEGIVCKNGNVFSINNDANDAEWFLEKCYYIAQGCKTIKKNKLALVVCNCKHCNTLEHNFHLLIMDVLEYYNLK